MIYTIGHGPSYEKYFKEQKVPTKRGRRDSEKDPQGGSVWRTEKEARKYCHLDYEVYGVEADWDKDTRKIDEKGVTWNELLVDRPLVKLDND